MANEIPHDKETQETLDRLMADPARDKRIENLKDETELKFSELMLRVRRLKEEYGRSDQGRQAAIVFTELEKVYAYWHIYINSGG